MLWFNFILGLIFIFFCFWVHGNVWLTRYHKLQYPKTKENKNWTLQDKIEPQHRYRTGSREGAQAPPYFQAKLIIIIKPMIAPYQIALAPGMKTISDSASVHSWGPWFWCDFCNRKQLHRSDLKSRASHNGQVLYHTLVQSELVFRQCQKWKNRSEGWKPLRCK